MECLGFSIFINGFEQMVYFSDKKERSETIYNEIELNEEITSKSMIAMMDGMSPQHEHIIKSTLFTPICEINENNITCNKLYITQDQEYNHIICTSKKTATEKRGYDDEWFNIYELDTSKDFGDESIKDIMREEISYYILDKYSDEPEEDIVNIITKMDLPESFEEINEDWDEAYEEAYTIIRNKVEDWQLTKNQLSFMVC